MGLQFPSFRTLEKGINVKKIPDLLVGVGAIVIMAGAASAATLNVVGGQLLGASDVIVDGSSYDVEFLDGTCINLYSGCNEASDFVFQTDAAAISASQALLDQVFIDGLDGLFDTDPTLTAGCNISTVCVVHTPLEVDVLGTVTSWRAINRDAGGTDSVSGVSLLSGSADLSSGANDVFAVWTPIPEPGTALLMGLGLLAMGVRSRTKF